MATSLTTGLLGSLRRRVRREIKEHLRLNQAIRSARYSLPQRFIRALIAGRSLAQFLFFYAVVDLIFIGTEAVFNSRFPSCLPGWTAPELKSMLKDIASYLITAQVGILGIVSVAVGIVTLISQRDERSSTNTDVRLYYMESLAYEVVLSGVALLLVLCAQLFWPLQFLTHLVNVGGPDLTFKVALTVLHVIWLLLNLAVFAQFLLTTLHFVEPSARERLRERYTANVIVPNDLALRLMRVFYLNAPKELVPETNDKTGPLIAFGQGMFAEGEVELRSSFPRPTELHDVWLRPLGLALRNWWRRSEQTLPQPRRESSYLRGHDVWLTLSPSFEGGLEGNVAWCRRKGGVALDPWERWVVRQSYRFARRKAGKDTLPTPSNFLEELADRVIGQIERIAITGFNGALAELLRYHHFILDAHNTQTDQGHPLSLAEVGGIWEAPYQEWIRQYRRVFESAASKLDVDTTFVETLGHVIMRLLPGAAGDLSPPVVTSLLDLGVHEVVVLEAWLTRRMTVEIEADGTAQPRLQLAGSDRRAYEEVVRNFVGAWENVLRVTDNLYGWKPREGRPALELWKAYGASLPFLKRHLRNTAFFLASAIWNEDEIGAEWYRDALLHWTDTLRPDVRADYMLQHRALLTPDLLALDWSQVEAQLQPYRRNPWPQPPSAETIFGVVLQRLVDDAVLVTATVALAWFANGQSSSGIGARAASLLLRRQVIAGEGSRFASGNARPPTIFRSLFSLLIRSAVAEGKYGADLDSLVQFLDGMSERRVVPGRVYSGWGWRGLDQIRPQVLAMLAANLPAQGDDGIVAWVQEIAENDILFADGDTFLRRTDSTLRAYALALGDQLDQNKFEHSVHALTPNADATAIRVRLQSIFADAIDAIQTQRTQRLRARTIDQEKWAALTALFTNALHPELYCFKDFRVEKVAAQASTIMEWRIGGIDKAKFVTPPMAWESSGDLNQVIVDAFRDNLTWQIWRTFHQRRIEVVNIDPTALPEGFWDIVADYAVRVGQPATLVTSYDSIENTLGHWLCVSPERRPPNRQIEYVQGHPSGGGTGYIGTVDGVEVFSADVEDHHSYLFSALGLDSVSYRLVAPDAFVSVEFEEGDDPWNGTILVRYAQHVEWRCSPFFELVAQEIEDEEATVP